MALNPIPVADLIAQYIQTNKPESGTPVTTTQLRDLWRGIMNEIYPDIVATAEVSSTIPASSIVTAGSPHTQTGPLSNVGITGSVS
jgi:hypothetical protein